MKEREIENTSETTFFCSLGLYATILELVGLLIRIRVKNDFWARSFSFKAFTARSIALLFGSLRIPLFSDNGIPTRFK